ncbi:MAG: GTP 3',8-cyclase MoaA [Rhodothermales bacterium]|nr:GTP 3',8-cyclase MoaA [Rhodothermales bacterium]
MFTDTFGRSHSYLRISVTERCDLRCRYCMPANGVPLTPRDEILTFEEIRRLAGIFAAGGVNKVRLTGGEPLVRRELPALVDMLSRIQGIEQLSMTTNGMLFDRHVEALNDAGLTAVNISLDTLREDRFEEITRRKGLAKALNAIDLALQFGFNPVKINAVVLRGVNDDELGDFARLTLTRPVHVRFIEYMPFQGNGWNDNRFLPYSDMLQILENDGLDLTREVDEANDTTKHYRVNGGLGTVGFISSMSEHFCSSCNRVRLTADGNLKVCLFGNAEVSLRDMMRAGASDDDITEAIQSAVSRKKASHNGMYNIANEENRPMILIGG